MQAQQFERRTKRSQQAEEALALQLERVRDQARLDALVLASEEGLAIAHSGEDEFCAELAALAPFIPQASPTQELLRVCATDFAGRRMYLVSYARERPHAADSWLEHAWHGVTRILSRAI